MKTMKFAITSVAVAASVSAASAAISLVGPTDISTGFVRQATYTFTNASLGGFDVTGYDKLVFVVSGENHAGGFASVTYGGVALTEAVEIANGQRGTSIWYLDGPITNGDLFVDPVNNSSNGIGGVLFGLIGTEAGVGVNTGSSLNGTSTLVTTADNSLVLASAVNNSASNPPTPTAPLISLARLDSGSSGHASGYQTIASSGTTVNSVFGAGGSTVDASVSVEFLAAVPEPSTTALIGLGGLALILRRRR
jgi:hypothetical protein